MSQSQEAPIWFNWFNAQVDAVGPRTLEDLMSGHQGIERI
jgi:hypothetical protein